MAHQPREEFRVGKHCLLSLDAIKARIFVGKAPSWLHKGLGLRCSLVAPGEAAFVFCPGVTRMIGMGSHTFLDDKSHLVWDQ